MAKGLSDAQVMRHAAEYRRLRLAAKELDKKAEPHKQEVIAELTRRGAKRLEAGGLAVTLKAKTTVSYKYDALKERLKAAQLRRITRTVVDPRAVAVEVEAGRISAEDIEACAERKDSAPYIDVAEVAG